jgi:hypothetical protein
MNRHPDRRSLAAVARDQRPHPAPPAVHAPGLDGHALAIPPAEEAAAAFLADILLGERDWTMAEVRALIALREATGSSGRGAPETEDAGGLAT